jgi:hypothetical protein
MQIFLHMPFRAMLTGACRPPEPCMDITRETLEQTFAQLSDTELLARYASPDLTELGRAVAREALEARDMAVPADAIFDTGNDAGGALPGSHALVVLTRFWTPTEAYLLQALLAAEGVPAVVADANTVQANQLWATALGGVRVLVPEAFLPQAQAVQAAFKNGEYALDENSTDYEK